MDQTSETRTAAGCDQPCEFCGLPCDGRPAHDVCHLCPNTADQPCKLMPEIQP